MDGGDEPQSSRLVQARLPVSEPVWGTVKAADAALLLLGGGRPVIFH